MVEGWILFLVVTLIICIACTAVAFLFGCAYIETQQKKKKYEELQLKIKILKTITEITIPLNDRINNLQKQIDEMKKEEMKKP